MLSPLGKALRKLRIDEGWLLKDMADGILMPSSYLSAIETGRKQPPEDFVLRLANWSRVSADKIKEIQRLVDESKQEFRIKLPVNSSGAYRETAAVLARSFENLSDGQIEKIRQILQKGNGN